MQKLHSLKMNQYCCYSDYEIGWTTDES